MNLVNKIILTIFATFALSFLMFFTFVSDGYTTDFNSQSKYTDVGVYKIDENFNLSKIENLDEYSDLKINKISIGNNIYYKEGDIRLEKSNDQTSIYLEEGIYFFDINDISTQYSIYTTGYKIKNIGPGAFIINTTNKNKKSVFSLSSKLNINFLNLETSESLAQIDLFPNMYLLAYPRYNNAIKNADLGKIKTSHFLDMLSTPIYSKTIQDDSFVLNTDLKKFLFYNNEDYDNFIKNIFDFRTQQIQKKKEEYVQLSKNDFYIFPGETYILKYYEYFLNDEKKKFYYKNLIIKELIQLLGENNNNKRKIAGIVQKMNTLKSLDVTEYDNMLSHILYYYDNIIYSQKQSTNIIADISNVKQQLKNQKNIKYQPSLVQLRYIYSEYHDGNLDDFHKNMNSFINNYEKEMNLSVYNEEHKIHNYFLFFLKNIFVGDFSKVEDHNQMVILFKKYIAINEIFIRQGDKIVKKTALFDNAELIKVFINIIQISFFQEKRENDVLILQKPAKITLPNYQILKTNLELLLDFQQEYKNLITNSTNRKDIILNLAYTKYSNDLNEYFDALGDYNRYALNRSKIALELPDLIDKNELNADKAEIYLEQFTGANSPNTIIEIRNYAYCLNPIESNILDTDTYCYEIKNFYVKGFKFDFFLNPYDKNRITFLNYYNNKNEYNNDNVEFIMDDIETGLDKLYENAKVTDRDKYDFSRFFINKYVNIGIVDTIVTPIEEDIDPFPKIEIGNESIAAQDLKLQLLTKNSPLEKIRRIIPISYKEIEIIKENGDFIAQVYPTNFQIGLEKNGNTETYSGKFEGKYIFKGNNHSFIESKIYIRNTDSIKKYDYYFDTQGIKIVGNILLSNVQNILEDVLSNFKRIKNTYSDLREIYDSNQITITYFPQDNILQYSVSETYIFNIKDNGSMVISENDIIIFTGRFTQIRSFLNTLQ